MVLLLADCLAWVVTHYFGLDNLSPVVLVAGTFTGVCVWLLQGLASDRMSALRNGMLAACVVCVPGAWLGAGAAVLSLSWWWSVRVLERRERRRA